MIDRVNRHVLRGKIKGKIKGTFCFLTWGIWRQNKARGQVTCVVADE